MNSNLGLQRCLLSLVIVEHVDQCVESGLVPDHIRHCKSRPVPDSIGDLGMWQFPGSLLRTINWLKRACNLVVNSLKGWQVVI